MKPKPFSTTAKIVGELVGLVICLFVIIWLMPQLAFVTNDWAIWLPIAIYTGIISTILKCLKHLVTRQSLKHLLEICNLAVSGYSLFIFLQIFPLDFGQIGLPNLNQLIAFAMTLALLVMIIAMAINFFHIFLPAKPNTKPKTPSL